MLTAVVGAVVLTALSVVPAYAMQIGVTVTGAGTQFTLDVEPSDSIENVKAKITDAKGYPAANQTLSFNDTVLDDDRTLADYGIGKDDVLTLVLTEPDAAPGTPGVPSVVPGDGSLTVSVVPPTSGGPVDSYTVTALDSASAGVVAGSCVVLADAVPLTCVISGLSRAVSRLVTVVATGPGGTSAPVPAAQAVVSVTNASVADLFRCDGAPGEPRSVPVSLTGLRHSITRQSTQMVLRMTPALPAAAGTLVVSNFPASSGAPAPDNAVDPFRFAPWAWGRGETAHDFSDKRLSPNSAGDDATGVTTTVYATGGAGGGLFADGSVLAQPGMGSLNKQSVVAYNQGVLFIPAPGSVYCADLRTYPVRFAETADATQQSFYALARFLDDPRIVPGAPVVRGGQDSATVTITAPQAAAEVTSYTVTAAPGGKTCTVPDPATSLSCTITGLDALPNNQRYTFTSTATGPWGAASTNTYEGFSSAAGKTEYRNDPTAGSRSAVSAVSPVGVAATTPVTITGANLSKVYGEDDPTGTLTPTITGVVTGEDLTQQPTCTRVAGEDVGEKKVTCSGAESPVSPVTGSPTYTFTYVDGSLTITKRSLTVTPDGQSIVYGDALPTSYPYTITSGSLVNGDAIAGSCGVSKKPTLPKNAGTYPIECASLLSAGDNYELTFGAGNLVIAKKAGVVTPDAKTITFGDEDPTFTYSISGVPDTYTLDTVPTCGVSGAHTDVGQYTITCSGGADKNYDLTQTATATLTVNKASVTVTAQNASKVYGTADPTFTSTVTGDGTVTGVNCGVTGAHANAGEYAIDCGGGSAGPNYTITYLPGTLTITKAGLTLTADNKTRAEGAANPTFTYTTTGLVNDDTTATASSGAPALSTTATTGSVAGQYPITIAAGTVASPNYTVSYVPGTLTVTPTTEPPVTEPALPPVSSEPVMEVGPVTGGATDGVPQVGVPVTVTVELPDVPGAAVLYQWQVVAPDGTVIDIPGATDASYTPSGEYAGYDLQVVVTTTAPGYAPSTQVVRFARTGVVQRGVFAVVKVKSTPLKPRVIKGKKHPVLGRKVRAVVPKGWAADLPEGAKLTYRWVAGSSPVKGVKNRKRSLRVTPGMVGKGLRVVVTVKAPGYETARFTSKRTLRVVKKKVVKPRER